MESEDPLCQWGQSERAVGAGLKAKFLQALNSVCLSCDAISCCICSVCSRNRSKLEPLSVFLTLVVFKIPAHAVLVGRGGQGQCLTTDGFSGCIGPPGRA
eukprot:764930-Hanusia_phi.AAC.1